MLHDWGGGSARRSEELWLIAGALDFLKPGHAVV